MVDILSVFWIVLDREWTSATALAQRGSAKGSAGAEAETGTLGWTDLDEEIYEIETMCHPVDRKSPDSIFGWCSSWANLKAIWLYTPGFQDEKEPSDMFTIVHHIKQTWSKQTFNAPKRTHSKLSMWKYTVPKNGASFFWDDFRCFLVPSSLGMLNFDSSGDGMLESVRPWPLVMAWKFCALAAAPAPDMVCIDQLVGPGFVPALTHFTNWYVLQ